MADRQTGLRGCGGHFNGTGHRFSLGRLATSAPETQPAVAGIADKTLSCDGFPSVTTSVDNSTNIPPAAAARARKSSTKLGRPGRLRQQVARVSFRSGGARTGLVGPRSGSRNVILGVKPGEGADMRGHPTRAARRLVLIASTTVVTIAGLGATAAPSMAGLPRGDDDDRSPPRRAASTRPGQRRSPPTSCPASWSGRMGNVKFTDSNNGAALGTIKPRLQCLLRLAAVRRHAHRPGLGAGGGRQHDRRRLLGRPRHQAEQRVDGRVRGNAEHVPIRQRTSAPRARRAAMASPAR